MTGSRRTDRGSGRRTSEPAGAPAAIPPADLVSLGARAVLDLRGRARLLGSLWRHQPAVVVWLRHFACLFCKEQAAELLEIKEAIEAEGARLLFVGNGNTRQARHFRERHVPGAAVFTDPSAYTYRAIGARESMVATVGGTLRNGPRAMRKGHYQYAFAGRPFQNGGVLVAMPGDTVAFTFISRVAGDHPANQEVLGALRRAVAAAAAPGPISAPEETPLAAAAEETVTGPRWRLGGDPAASAPLPPWPRTPRWSLRVPGEHAEVSNG